jgi:hypothetical protein
MDNIGLVIFRFCSKLITFEGWVLHMWAAAIKVRVRIASLNIVPEVFLLPFVKCRDAAHRAVVHSGMAARRRRAQTPLRLAVALTSRRAPPSTGHTLTMSSTTPCYEPVQDRTWTSSDRSLWVMLLRVDCVIR